MALMVKRFFKTPYTLVAHGIDVHESLSKARKQALLEADRVIAVSTWTRGRLERMVGVLAERIEVLANTYDDERFCPGSAPADLRARYGIGEGDRVILTVARLDPGDGYKGYDRILVALPEIRKECGNVRYLIAGKGGDRERLEAMARELGVENAVTCAGFVPDGELADHYRLADVFAMPSTGEGFGIVFLEAMGCGTPVLGGNQDGAVDALDQGRLGLLVNPTSVDAIGAGLISLLQRKGPDLWFEREQLSQAVKKTYGREAFRRRVSELFPVL
jgi:glycosyltransferase involved in cell wall biosynthesis